MSPQGENFIGDVRRLFDNLEKIHDKISMNQDAFASELDIILGNIHDNRLNKPGSSITYCLNELQNLLLAHAHEELDRGQIPFGWALLEGFFYSIATNIVYNKCLISDYAFYASATVLALENLLTRCLKSGEIAVVFIATTQTPGELVFGGSKIPDDKYERFDAVNQSYKIQFRRIVEGYIRKGGHIVIERHVFARRNEYIASSVHKVLEKFLFRFEDTMLPEHIEVGDQEEFEDWVNKNHACKIPGYPSDSSKDMARVQWFEAPAEGSLKKVKFNPNSICTDLIVFGTSRLESANRLRVFPPIFVELDVKWHFGLQSIDSGVVAEGRVVKPLQDIEFKGYINFLGFEAYTLDSFIACLQKETRGTLNPLNLGVSGYIVKENPWEKIWKDKPVQNVSCFISYSSKDEEFVQKLYSDLNNRGIRCWMAGEDLRVGDRIRDKIDQSIRMNNKLLIVLSEHSIRSAWVEEEIEAAIEKEIHVQTQFISPIRIDDAVLHAEKPWAAKIRRSRQIGDFTRWQDQHEYQKALNKLTLDLR